MRALAFAALAAVASFSGAGGVLAYDAAKDSPFTLLAVPADGSGYFQAREQARRLWRENKAAEAEPLLERLARDYPRDAWNWMTLARVKTRLGKPLDAAIAHERAGNLIGWDAEYPMGYRLAANQLAAGDRRAALATLKWMIVEQGGIHRASLFEWQDFAALREDAEFLALIGHAGTKPAGRDDGWRGDIDYLLAEAKRVNPVYRHRDFPAEVTRRHEALRAEVPGLSDEQLYMGMRRMLAPLRQGHIAFMPPPGSRYLPVRLYAFPEGVFIIEARAPHADLVGARVAALGSLTTEEAWRKLSQARSTDGDMEQAWGVFELAATGVLKGLGAIDSQASVELTVQGRDGALRKVTLDTLEAMPPERQDRLVAPPGVAAPVFLRDLEKTFWHMPMRDGAAMYVQVNNIRDMRGETLAQYGRRLWSELEAAKPSAVILDLRHNNGGNTFLYVELLRTLTAFARVPGQRVYALIGRRTYSAAGNLVTDLERLVEPVFAGEASSECCRMHGDPASVVLPFSKIRGELTAVVWNLSSPMDGRREMSPDLPVQLTAKAYFAGEDPALEAVLRVIGGNRM
jgi:hypothetical protein